MQPVTGNHCRKKFILNYDLTQIIYILLWQVLFGNTTMLTLYGIIYFLSGGVCWERGVRGWRGHLNFSFSHFLCLQGVLSLRY